MLVLEQLLDQIERLPARTRQKVTTHLGAREQVLALVLRQRLGEALGQQNARRDGFSPAIAFAKRFGVAPRKARDIGERLVEITPEHERGAVPMRLPELVARRDVGDLVVQPQVLEPGRLADVEMIDGMQIVIEARLGDLARRKSATVAEPSLDQQNIEASAREIAAEDQAVMAGTDDDAVIVSLQRLRHSILLRTLPRYSTLRSRLFTSGPQRFSSRSIAAV